MNLNINSKITLIQTSLKAEFLALIDDRNRNDRFRERPRGNDRNRNNGGYSEADIEITKQLVTAGKIIGIHLIDHVIVGKDSFASVNVDYN